MYKENSVSPSTIRVTVEDQDIYFTTVAGVRRVQLYGYCPGDGERLFLLR